MRKHPGPHDEEVSAQRAFTLIELLVVIAIIGILAALLLPVLTRAKQRAQSAQCMTNSKQITLGWIMYADDNNDLLAPNDYPWTTQYFTQTAVTQSHMKNWVVGTMAASIDSRTWQELAPSTANLHVNTVLATYVPNAASYLCPADHYIDPLSHVQHVRSYSMNSAVGSVYWSSFQGGTSPPLGSPAQGGWLLGAAYTVPQNTWQTFGKTVSIKKPSQTWCILDENPYTINDGSFAVSATVGVGATYLIDFPSGLHGNAGGMAFCDGHSVIHRWLDARTYTPTLAGIAPGQSGGNLTGQNTHISNPDDQDCFFLGPITSQPAQ
jgi:prepilin-type N-terminal cleavage/methylation domain-containing protein/prepilin-type processing-associated H-X9-DG protein